MRRLLLAAVACMMLAACARDTAPIVVTPALVGPANVIEVNSDRAPAMIAIDMPDMQMPAKVYTVERTGPHTYSASNVRFSMAGTWRVIARDASGAPVASFTIDVR